MTIAVIGPDGAGKTEYCLRFNKKILHGAPRTLKWKLPKNKTGRILHETLIALEKLFVRVKFKAHENLMMDNCYIDAEVYAHLWSIKTGSSIPLAIARFSSHYAYKPETIHQLVVEPSKATPTNIYSLDDIELLNSLYVFTLKLHGYKQYNMKEYKRGVLIIWRKDMSFSSTVERRKK